MNDDYDDIKDELDEDDEIKIDDASSESEDDDDVIANDSSTVDVTDGEEIGVADINKQVNKYVKDMKDREVKKHSMDEDALGKLELTYTSIDILIELIDVEIEHLSNEYDELNKRICNNTSDKHTISRMIDISYSIDTYKNIKCALRCAKSSK